MDPRQVKCHQRKIREEQALIDPHPVMESLTGCRVEQITRQQAESIIFKYEWLGTMPTVSLAYYGLLTPDNELVGVTCFGTGAGTNARNICGAENRDITICLERGANVHWAHPHAGSYLVARACKLASRDYGWKVFYAYSDETAGEIGTIYQACNWTYIGRGVGRGNGNTSRAEYINPEGERVSSRAMRRLCAPFSVAEVWPFYMVAGWTRRRVPDKHKYVWIEAKGRLKIDLQSKLVALPFPKR